MEAIPKGFDRPYDPLSAIDHQKVAMYTAARLHSGKGIAKEMQRAYDFNRHFRPELLERLINRGKFIEPVSEDLHILDEELIRMRVFNAGCALALIALDNFADEADVDRGQWRDVWIALPEGADAPAPVPEGRPMTDDDCYRVGAAIIALGQRRLSELEQPYQDMVATVADERPERSLHENVFHASFGYAFGVGRSVISGIVFNREVDKEVAAYAQTVEAYSDEELKSFIRTERRRARAHERQKRQD